MFNQIVQDVNSNTETLTAEAETALHNQYASGDQSAGKRLVEAHLKTALILALEYVKRGGAVEELFQEGVIGLYRALDKFDPSRGVRFVSYAAWWVRSQIQNFLRENSRQVTLPSHLFDQIIKLSSTTVEFVQQEHREPTDKELSEILELSEKKIAQLKAHSQASVSFDQGTDIPDEGHDDNGIHSTLADIHQETAAEYAARLDEIERMETLMNRRLTKQERDVLKHRYGIGGLDEHTLQETGKALGVSTARVQQVERTALAKLRRVMV